MKKVLLAGESWISYTRHIKGFDSFFTSTYEEGIQWIQKSIEKAGYELFGITTVCGESEKRAAVADAICRTAGKRIPIVAGLDSTMQPVPVYPTPDGADALQFWQHNTYEKADAPAFLYQKIK